MKVFLVCVTESSETGQHEEVDITHQKIVLGRNCTMIKCDDPRISRTHGLLSHSAENSEVVILKATHTNPIFYKINGSNNVSLLVKDSEILLKHDDQFGFLPNTFWYKVVVKKTLNDNIFLRIRPVAELNNSQNFEEILPQVSNGRTTENAENPEHSQSLQDNLIIIPTPDCSIQRPPSLTDVPNNLESGSFLLMDSLESAAEKRLNENQGNADTTSSKRQKVCNEASEPNNSENNVASSSNQIPTETCPTLLTVKKEEPSDERESCEYGVGCYRRNLEHRREQAHPGDADYRRPDYPPAPPGTPPCPYGNRCYRRNPDHFIEYSHPTSTTQVQSSNNNSNVPSSSSNNLRTTRPIVNRTVKIENIENAIEEQDEFEDEDEQSDEDFSGDSDESFHLDQDANESSDDIESDSDDNSAILDDGDANED